MILPTIHTNGDRAETLRDGFLAAYQAVNEASKLLQETAPNGRNFYPQGDEAIDKAIHEHCDRLAKVGSVADELLRLAEHCDKLSTKPRE